MSSCPAFTVARPLQLEPRVMRAQIASAHPTIVSASPASSNFGAEGRNLIPSHPALNQVLPRSENPIRARAIWNHIEPAGWDRTVRLANTSPASQTTPRISHVLPTAERGLKLVMSNLRRIRYVVY